MEDYGSPTFSGLLDNVAQSLRSTNHFRPSSPSGDGIVRRQDARMTQRSHDGLLSEKELDLRDWGLDEPITHLVAGKNRVAIAMKDKRILLIDRKAKEIITCDMGRYYGSKLSQIKIYRIFLDPTGKFLLISVALAADNQPYENLLYVTQLQSLQKLKNHLISAVAWNHKSSISDKQQSQVTGTLSTGTILLGTSKGLVLQTELLKTDQSIIFSIKKGPERYVNEIFDVEHEAGAITGIEYHQIISDDTATERNFVILLSTNNRLYRKVGTVPANIDPPPLHLIMSQNKDVYKEVAGRFVNSKLDLHYPSKSSKSLPTRFAWLTEPGIMTSELHEQLTACRSSFESNEDIKIIPYVDPEEASLRIPSSASACISPQFGGMSAHYHEKPISVVVTNFHVIILMRHCLRAICILNEQTVYEDIFPASNGEVRGMSKDPVDNIIFVYFKRAITRYKVNNENRNIWKIFLDRGDFDLAKRYSSGSTNYDRVLSEEATHYFKLGEYEKSAELFAGSMKPFEDVCLMFMDVKRPKALRKYLTIRLDATEYGSIQLTMTLCWLFELIVSSIAYLEVGHASDQASSEVSELYQELEELLDCKQVIDCIKQHPNLFYGVLTNYAHFKTYVKVATLIGDYERLLIYHMEAKEYDKVLDILRNCKRVDQIYRHGHLLMKHKPKEFVDVMIAQSNLDVSKLIPILIQENPFYNQSRETIRFLEHCVYNLHTDCKVVHNYLFDRYARFRDEDTIIEFLKSDIGYLDLQSCLRVCTDLKLQRTCVEIFACMNLYYEAVSRALAFDLELAKSIAKRVASEDQQRKLWLIIAKNISTKKDANIETSVTLLNETKLLRVDDFLGFFPEHKTIGEIKAFVVQSLRSKRNEDTQILDDFNNYKTISNETKAAQAELKTGYVRLRCGQKCDICSKNIMSKSSTTFPTCGHRFHWDCITDEMKAIDPNFECVNLEELECIHCGGFVAKFINEPPCLDGV